MRAFVRRACRALSLTLVSKLAGHGAANVTLGIPRLREIVMTASQNIKTPTMQLPILSTVSDSRLKTFCQSSTRLTLSQVVDEVTVQERLTSKSAANNHSRQKLYTVRLQLYPRKDYVAEHSITPEQILVGVQRTFVPLLDKAILKEIKQNDKEIKSQAGDLGKARKVSAKEAANGPADDAAGDGGEDGRPVGRDAGEEEDGDADDDRRARQGKDEKEYESDEDEEAPADEEADLEKQFQSGSEKGEGDSDDSDDEDAEVAERRSKKETLERMKMIERKVATASRYIEKVTFDKEEGQFCEFELEVCLAWPLSFRDAVADHLRRQFSSRAHKLLLVGIVEGVCRQSIIHEIPGIARCFVAKAANENDAVNVRPPFPLPRPSAEPS